jgi:hypothetical protein
MLVTKASDAAENYCGKLLGAVCMMLFLQTASKGVAQGVYSANLSCDNKGVISHGSSTLLTLPENQRQSDLVQLVKYLVSTSPVKVA